MYLRKNRSGERPMKTPTQIIQDIQYILDRAGSSMVRCFYDGAIGRLSGEHEGYGFQAPSFSGGKMEPLV